MSPTGLPHYRGQATMRAGRKAGFCARKVCHMAFGDEGDPKEHPSPTYHDMVQDLEPLG